MRNILCLILVFASAGQGFTQTPAVEPAPVVNSPQVTEALMAEAIALFQTGKFSETLAKIEEVKKGLNGRLVPQLLFIEGASHFNLSQYDKTITILDEYVKNFPAEESLASVKMVLGRSYINKGDVDKGITLLKETVNLAPAMKAQMGLLIAEALLKNERSGEAMTILLAILRDGIQSAESTQAAMMAAELYVSQGNEAEAGVLMEKVKGFASGGDGIVKMNDLYLKLGDSMLERKDFKAALKSYQFVRRHSEIRRLQKEAIAKIEQSLNTPGGVDPKLTKEDLEEKLRLNQSMLTELEKLTDYDALLYYRLGRCYFEMARYWEALLAFEVIVNDFVKFPERDRCVFGMILANANLKRVKQARELCEIYMGDYSESAEFGMVSEMYGMLAYENGQKQEAVEAFQKAENFPKANRERLRFLRGSVLFELQKFDEARKAFASLVKDYPESTHADDALYRVALIYFFQNDSEGAKKALADYIEKNPKGQYVVDARYRVAFITYQGKDVDAAMQELIGIIKDAPDDLSIGQVHCLLGDAYKQKGDNVKALEHYILGVEKAKGDDVLGYAMDQATELYVSKRQWKLVGDMWQKYLDTHKDNEEQELKAILWISRARVKDDQPEEAVKLLADAIKTKIGNPGNQQVDGLIQQLASLKAPKKRRASTPAEKSVSEIDKELELLLTPPQMNGTAHIRILFAKAWLARVMRDSAKMEQMNAIILEIAKAEDLSAMLLAIVGDKALEKGRYDKATECYNRLNEYFKSSEYADGAAVGLAEIAYAKEDYEGALKWFSAAIDEYAGSSRLKDATLGKAKTLFKLKKYEEAKRLYVQVQNTKEWRGEAHAMALFMQGEIEFANQRWGQAIPYYQRVFIAHQKWKGIMAQSYLQCARAFRKRNEPANPPTNNYPDWETAKLILIEMVKRADLKNLPEMKQAESELAKM